MAAAAIIAAEPLIEMGVKLFAEIAPEIWDAVKAYHIAHAKYPALTSAQIAQIDSDNSDKIELLLTDSDSKVSGLVIPAPPAGG